MSADTELELLGRDSATATLRDSLARAVAGRGGVVLLSGEAGIGKTVLAESVAREATKMGARVAMGRAWEYSDAPPYFPLVPCLRSVGVELETGGAGRAPFEVWDATLSALASAASAAPVVWVIEDLHAADMQTLDVVAFLARTVRAIRVLLIVTARSEDPRLGEAAAQRLARIALDGIELRLEALERDDIAELAQRVSGRALSYRTVARLGELTGGNPLFVAECARGIRTASPAESAPEDLVLPPNLRQAVAERVSLLPEGCRRLLTMAAVLGRDFDAAVLHRMRGSSPAQTIDALEPALRAGVIDEVDAGRFRFRHVLVRDAVEEAISAEDRVAIHALAEGAIGAEEGASSEFLVERARHALAGASTRESAALALSLAARAASRLEEQGAFDRAYAMHQRMERVRKVGLAAPASPEERLELARIAREAGNHAEALRICEEVSAHARTSHDASLLGNAAWVRGADLRPGVVDGSLVALLEEALAAQPEGESTALRWRLLARLAAARQPAPDEPALLDMARHAIARARELGDAALMRDVLYFAGAVLVDTAPYAERMALASELLERALESNDVGKALRAHARLAADRVETGDFLGFDDGVERMLAISNDAGQPRHRWRPLLFASMRAQMSGRFDQSERFLVEASQLAGLTDDPALALSLVAHRMRRARLMHHDEQALMALDEYESSMRGIPHGELVVRALRLGCLARQRDTARVTLKLAELGPREATLWERGFQAWLAEAYALAGSEEQRQRAREFFAPSAASELPVSHVAITYEGPTARMLGLLDASVGEHALAERRLRRALEKAQSDGLRPWVAQLRFDLATVLVSAGRQQDAGVLFADASALARELGMDGLARRASELVPNFHRRDTSQGSHPSPPRLSLTRHGEMWQLEYIEASFMLRDSRGLWLLARLVEHAGEEMHVLVLASDEDGALVESNAGDALDPQARRRYAARLRELEGELEEARSNSDLGRVARLDAEIDALETELSRAIGLGGRSRQACSVSERARVNVQRRIKAAISRIAHVAPELGVYLRRAVRTGTYCSFRP